MSITTDWIRATWVDVRRAGATSDLASGRPFGLREHGSICDRDVVIIGRVTDRNDVAVSAGRAGGVQPTFGHRPILPTLFLA